MGIHDFFQVLLYLGALCITTPLLGWYIARVYDENNPLRLPGLHALERVIYKLSRIDPDQPMPWKSYAGAVLIFSGLGVAAVFIVQALQHRLPFNPQHFP
ncbi:MAG: potassium-transporting ATPase subunit KdpA, partial [Chitinivibrionales bacterium]|nr:potassium-transporting ATPase subunit KdpA [Chitinivibrionales bacterium]